MPLKNEDTLAETVYITKTDYDYNTLKPAVFEMLGKLDNGLLRPGASVLIKPNLLAPSTPEQAIVTHPFVVKAVAEYALGKGAIVQVSDSIAMGTFEKVVEKSGLNKTLEDMDLTLAPLMRSTPVDSGEKFKGMELAAEVLEADVIINLPKLKSHSQMAMTLAVKNLFGCVVGLRKPEWHFRVGERKELFAELLVSIHNIVKPQINLMDAVLCLEGLGPGTNGTPREVGYILGSNDAVSLDMVACRLVGMKPDELMSTAAAIRMGHTDSEPEVVGQFTPVKNFHIPDTMDLLFGPPIIRGFLRRHIATRPVSIPSVCKYCGECAKICPARAITIKGKTLKFDYDKCIRCYCCVEVCPHKAMDKRETWLKRAIRLMTRSRG